MKLKMLTSLGLLDARRLGLPAHAEGDVIDCDRAAADALLKCRWAAPHAEPEPQSEPEPKAPAAKPEPSPSSLTAPPKSGGGK